MRGIFAFLIALSILFLTQASAETPATKSAQSIKKQEEAKEEDEAEDHDEEENKDKEEQAEKYEEKAEGPTIAPRPDLEPPGIEPLSSPGFKFSTGGAYRRIDEDHYLAMNLILEIDAGMLGAGFQLPLTFLIKDNYPDENEGPLGGALRKEEWDETSEKLKFIKYLRFGREGQKAYLRLGELEYVTFGHGTIVSDYYNNVNIDHWLLGVNGEVNLRQGGGEVLMGDVFHPYLWGTRVYVRPFAFIDPASFWNNLAVGVTFVTDTKAPYELLTNYDLPDVRQACAEAIALPDFDCPPEELLVDPEGNLRPSVQSSKSISALGFDAELRLLNTSVVLLTPYADLNKLFGGGVGFHNGVLNEIAFSDLVRLENRLEWRAFQGDYIPHYFDVAYEIHRYIYPLSRDYTGGQEIFTKRYALHQLQERDASGKLGYYAESAFKVLSAFTLGLAYEDYEGRYNSNLKAYLDIPKLFIFGVGARYYKFNFEKAAEIFEFDENSLFIGTARINLGAGVFISANLDRVWRFDKEDYKFAPTDSYSFGAGWQANF